MEMSAESRKKTLPEDGFAGSPEMAALMRTRDWTATALGPVLNWPQSLRTASSICLASSFPALVWWGTDLIALYNDACHPLLGTNKHPQALGQRGCDCWPEIWPVLGSALEGVLATGEALQLADRAIALERNGCTEERYFTFSCSPIRDESGKVGGVFTALTETTQRVIAERRLSACGDFAARSQARACEEEPNLSQTFASTALDAGKAIASSALRDRKLRAETEAAEERLAVVIESIADGLAFFDHQLRYTHANRAAALLLCKEPEALLGKTIGEVFPEAIAQTFYKEYRRAIAEQAAVEFEEFFPPLNIWLKIRARPSKEGLAVSFQDITQRKRDEEKLLRCEQQFKILAENAPDPIALLDAEGRYLYANRAVEGSTGLPAEYFIGKTIEEVGFSEEIAALWRDKVREVVTTGQACLFEQAFPTPSGIRYYQSWLFPGMTAGGAIASVASITRDITELKAATETLRETERALQTLVEASPLAIIALDSQGNIKMWSPAAERIFGWTEREVLGNFIPFVPEDKKEEFRALHQRKLQGQSVAGVELRRQKKDGSPVDVAVWGAPMCDAEGNIDSTMAVMADISDRKRSEEALRKERDFTSAILNTIESLVVVLDREGQIVTFNRACEKTTGYTFAEVKGACFWDLFLIPEEIEPVKGVFENLREGAFPSEYENYWLAKDGSRRLVAWSNTVMLDEVGQVEYVIGTGIDITERRQTEAALGQSEAKFRRLAESNLMGIFFADFSGRIVDSNDAFLQMMGYGREDLRSGKLRWDTMTPPEYRPLDEAKIQEMKVSGACTPWEKEYIRSDGTRVPVFLGVAPLEEPAETCICFALDLTERKQTEEALRFALQKLNFHVENTPLAVIEWDREFRVIRWSTSAQKLFGWQPEEVLRKHPSEWRFVFEEDVELWGGVMERLTDGSAQWNMSVNRNHAKDGSVVDCEWYNSALLDEEGNLISVLSLVLDVTERSRTLEALQRSEERFRLAARCASDLIYEWDIYSGAVEWFGNVDEKLGYAFGEFPRTLEGWKNSIHPDDCEQLAAAVQRHLSDREPFFQEYRIQRKDGTFLYWAVRGTAVWDDFGTPYKWIGAASDITHAKQAESEIVALNQALKRRVKELQTLLEVIPIGIGMAEDALGDRITVNPALAKHLGIDSDTNISSIAPAGETVIHYKMYRNGREIPIEELPLRYAARHGVEVTDMELDIVRDDGKIVNILASAAPLFDEEGKTRGCVCATVDITERKQTEEALRLSEERYRSLAEALPQLVCLSGSDGIIDYCNQSWFKYTGLTLEETKKSAGVDAIHPDYCYSFLRKWKTALKTGNGFSIAFRLRRVDGAYRWHLGRAVPIKGEGDRILAWLGTATDIDDQKRAEEQERFLAEASSVLVHSLEYETTLERVARLAVPCIADWCAIDLVKKDGSIEPVAVSHVEPLKAKLAQELHRRYPPKLNIDWGMPLALRLGTSQVYSQIPESFLTQAAHDAEHEQILRELGIFSAIFVPLVARGRTLGVISFVVKGGDRCYSAADLPLVENLAQRAALAIDNARLYREAQEANRLKDEFLATLSHELRTPLNSILGWTQILRSRKLSEEKVFKALETIERNARSQTQLIEDLLDVSRIIRGKLRLNVRSLNLVSVVEAAVEAVRPAADAKAIQLLRALDATAGPISGDADRLQQVVWNLLSNAIKFTPSGGQVTVLLERTNSHVEISVIDTGTGISREFLPYVFDRFRQADGSTTRSHSGLGLGLAIVRHLVELHGGSVFVESPGLGQGSTFRVRLPLMPVCLLSDAIESEADEGSRQPSVETPALDGVRVLVVDDQEDARAFLAAVLEECGALVSAAASVSEAIAAIEQFQPHVLISDIAMPFEDGYSLIRKIRTAEAERGGFLPAAALTAYARDEDRTRALLSGFQLHLPKPIEAAELVAVVANLVGRVGRF